MVRKIILTGVSLMGIMLSSGMARADATPDCNNGILQGTTECGTNSLTIGGFNQTTVGTNALGFLPDGTAVGTSTLVASTQVLFVPYSPLNLDSATALGSYSFAIGVGNLAVGAQAGVGLITYNAVTMKADFDPINGGTAIGDSARVVATNGTALGFGAMVTAADGIAVGVGSSATANLAIAIGSAALANGTNGVAIGNGASNASFANSVAIGSGSINTAANQVSVGGRTIGGVANGVVATDAVNVSQLNTATAGFATGIAAINSAVIGLQDDVGILYNQNRRQDRLIDRANEGVAMALAMESPYVPAGSRFALSGGIGGYQGRHSLATAISAAVGEKANVSAGLGYGLNSGEIGYRAGFQIAF